jgi:hypothetical protein
MRSGSSRIHSRGRGGRDRLEARLKEGRKARLRWLELDSLESRTLLATTPAPAGAGAAINLSSVSAGTNANSPTVLIDPYNPQDIVAVWSVDGAKSASASVGGAYSTDGGAHWSGLSGVAPDLTDPNGGAPYAFVTSPSLGFDSQHNFYVLSLETTGTTDGALELTGFNFSGGSPSPLSIPNSGIVYQWVNGSTAGGSDAATDPVLAVDASRPPAGTPADPYANNVYIAWASVDIAPIASGGGTLDRAELVVATPISNPVIGEESMAFGGVQTISMPGNTANAHPQLVINQNQGGQVTVAWNDLANSNLQSGLVLPGDSYGFTGATGQIYPALSNSSPGN